MNDYEREDIASAILDMGEMLLRAGAEVNRVEDTIRRIGKAYGFARVEIFSITNMISMTMHCADGKIFTQIRRVTSIAVDLEKVARTNDLSRRICKNPIPLEELRKEIKDIEQNTRQYSRGVKYASYVVAAGAFCVFFGGGWKEAVIAMITGLAVSALIFLLGRLKVAPIIATLVNSFLMTLVVALLTGGGKLYEVNVDPIMMGDIMLLIPGLALTTSIRDLITGDTVSGLMGICDALLKSFAIAAGCAPVLVLLGMVG